MSDVLRLTAPQEVATTVLGPCAIGWMLQLMLGGMATSMALALLLSKSARVGKATRPLLLMAVVFNLACMAINAAEIWIYMISQHRDSVTWNTYNTADSLAPLPAGLAAAVCQLFMGIRCLKITGRNIFLSVAIAVGILASLAGAVWLTVANVRLQQGLGGPSTLLAPTELWLWAAVVVDLVIAGVLSYSLRKMKKGFNKSTDEFIASLAQLAFGTCVAPLFFEIFTAITYAATVHHGTLWNMFNATAPPIPALYLISFCYCLRASAASHARLESSSFRPSSAVASNTGVFIKSMDQSLPIGQITNSMEERKRTQKAARQQAITLQIGVSTKVESAIDVEDDEDRFRPTSRFIPSLLSPTDRPIDVQLPPRAATRFDDEAEHLEPDPQSDSEKV